MFGIGTTELILIIIVVILLFGARRIPEIARGLGRAAHEFKKAKNEIAREADDLAADEKTRGQTDGKPGKPDAG